MSELRRTVDAPPVRLVHLGLGNFFRAHQAWYTTNAPDAAEWGIAAFTGRSTERSHARAAALTSQDGLYTLITRAADGDRFEIVRSLARIHVAEEHAAWLGYLADPQVQVITSTVTEAGYVRDAGGGIDLDRPEVKADLEALRADLTAPVTTAPARLVAGFAARRLATSGPISMMPCDNLPGNGAAVAEVIDDLATQVDPGLARWIAGNVFYVTTMVDRITPEPTRQDIAGAMAATGLRDRAAVVTEPFSEWVISGEFASGRPRWEDAGATFTTDVSPFEDRKLWMLNGAHSMLAYAGSIRGHVTVADAMRDATCLQWLDQWWDASSRHLSLPAADNTAYRAALIERFANPRLQHRLDQIAWDGSQKLPIRVLPTLRRERAAGRLPVGVVRPIAAWVCHLRGCGAKVTDARAAEFLALASGPLPEAVPLVLKGLDPELAADESVVTAVLAQARELSQS
ncbi:MAG TPA: mannitol dehydrogenase family protein [Dermatophilaceae bacterium]|nr:mannitol dehydrogenase family protein [Dermatophilaceae bacterium]